MQRFAQRQKKRNDLKHYEQKDKNRLMLSWKAFLTSSPLHLYCRTRPSSTSRRRARTRPRPSSRRRPSRPPPSRARLKPTEPRGPTQEEECSTVRIRARPTRNLGSGPLEPPQEPACYSQSIRCVLAQRLTDPTYSLLSECTV